MAPSTERTEGNASRDVPRRPVIIDSGRLRDPEPSVEMEATFLWSRLSAAEARRFVTDTLVTWGCDDRVDDAALLASELATNALLHARTGFTVGLTRRPDGSIRVSVRDTGIGSPRPCRAGPLDGSGRGLAMVEALATEWGADLSPGGKVVWADLRAVSGR